jgi:hypothetical protein
VLGRDYRDAIRLNTLPAEFRDSDCGVSHTFANGD